MEKNKFLLKNFWEKRRRILFCGELLFVKDKIDNDYGVFTLHI
ncbi:hypothetical protein HMPREF9163_01648 [Selenomonas sp. oral taxon 138 str. F0429]|nr:hypothetical protein HMPREF9163_01648 [Selenomonas sp. oral taxon 138 str. F0429]